MISLERRLVSASRLRRVFSPNVARLPAGSALPRTPPVAPARTAPRISSLSLRPPGPKAIRCRSFTPAQPVYPAASLRDFSTGALSCSHERARPHTLVPALGVLCLRSPHLCVLPAAFIDSESHSNFTGLTQYFKCPLRPRVGFKPDIGLAGRLDANTFGGKSYGLVRDAVSLHAPGD